MKIAIFISVFLLIFASAGYYLYVRIIQAFSGTVVESSMFLILYVFLLSSFLIGKIIEQASVSVVSDALVRIGSVGAGFFLYALLFVIFFDLIRLLNYVVPFYPDFISGHYQQAKLFVGIFSFSVISVIVLVGFLNARTPNVKHLEISINKKKADLDTMTIVAVSDIHLGTMVNHSKTKRLIETVNDLNPDLVLIGGDIIDDNLNVVKHHELLNYFKELSPKYGVYSCLGNHEYISKAYADLDYFEQNGIHMLKDSVVKIDDKFYVVGRNDIEGKSVFGGDRKSLEQITEGVDFELPVFLLDHQPYKLKETAEYAVDFQFSGHTHNGQIWPLNYITGLLFEEDWGYLKKKDTHFYISAGYGTAVMPMRVGNRSEVVCVKLINEK